MPAAISTKIDERFIQIEDQISKLTSLLDTKYTMLCGLVRKDYAEPDPPDATKSDFILPPSPQILGTQKVDFPLFEGNNPQEWLQQCNRYFLLYPMDDLKRVFLASLFLDGQANSWYLDYQMGKTKIFWDQFSHDILIHFDGIKQRSTSSDDQSKKDIPAITYPEHEDTTESLLSSNAGNLEVFSDLQEEFFGVPVYSLEVTSSALLLLEVTVPNDLVLLEKNSLVHNSNKGSKVFEERLKRKMTVDGFNKMDNGFVLLSKDVFYPIIDVSFILSQCNAHKKMYLDLEMIKYGYQGHAQHFFEQMSQRKVFSCTSVQWRLVLPKKCLFNSRIEDNIIDTGIKGLGFTIDSIPSMCLVTSKHVAIAKCVTIRWIQELAGQIMLSSTTWYPDPGDYLPAAWISGNAILFSNAHQSTVLSLQDTDIQLHSFKDVELIGMLDYSFTVLEVYGAGVCSINLLVYRTNHHTYEQIRRNKGIQIICSSKSGIGYLCGLLSLRVDIQAKGVLKTTSMVNEITSATRIAELVHLLDVNPMIQIRDVYIQDTLGEVVSILKGNWANLIMVVFMVKWHLTIYVRNGVVLRCLWESAMFISWDLALNFLSRPDVYESFQRRGTMLQYFLVASSIWSGHTQLSILTLIIVLILLFEFLVVTAQSVITFDKCKSLYVQHSDVSIFCRTIIGSPAADWSSVHVTMLRLFLYEWTMHSDAQAIQDVYCGLYILPLPPADTLDVLGRGILIKYVPQYGRNFFSEWVFLFPLVVDLLYNHLEVGFLRNYDCTLSLHGYYTLLNDNSGGTVVAHLIQGGNLMAFTIWMWRDTQYELCWPTTEVFTAAYYKLLWDSSFSWTGRFCTYVKITWSGCCGVPMTVILADTTNLAWNLVVARAHDHIIINTGDSERKSGGSHGDVLFVAFTLTILQKHVTVNNICISSSGFLFLADYFKMQKVYIFHPRRTISDSMFTCAYYQVTVWSDEQNPSCKGTNYISLWKITWVMCISLQQFLIGPAKTSATVNLHGFDGLLLSSYHTFTPNELHTTSYISHKKLLMWQCSLFMIVIHLISLMVETTCLAQQTVYIFDADGSVQESIYTCEYGNYNIIVNGSLGLPESAFTREASVNLTRDFCNSVHFQSLLFLWIIAWDVHVVPLQQMSCHLYYILHSSV